ncbi:MAG: hypothetical protein K6356_10535 [Chloroflexus sp.]
MAHQPIHWLWLTLRECGWLLICGLSLYSIVRGLHSLCELCHILVMTGALATD